MTGRTHLSFGIITAAAFSTFVLKTDSLTYKGDSYLYFFFRNKSGLNFKGGRFYLIPSILRVGSDSTAAKVLAFFLSIGFAFLAMKFGNGLMNYDDVTTLVSKVSSYFQSI